MRHLADAHGREWHVYERIGSHFSPAAGRASLVFDTDGLVRRLWRYPAATMVAGARIYAHALRLKAKGAPYFPHPERNG